MKAAFTTIDCPGCGGSAYIRINYSFGKAEMAEGHQLAMPLEVHGYALNCGACGRRMTRNAEQAEAE